MSNKVKNFEVAYVNQYIQWWDVDEHEVEEVYRTDRTMQQVKDDLALDGRVYDGRWFDDGKTFAAYGILNDSQGSAGKVVEFNKTPFGKEGYHSIEEIMDADLVWIKGYGIVDDKESFKKVWDEKTHLVIDEDMIERNIYVSSGRSETETLLRDVKNENAILFDSMEDLIESINDFDSLNYEQDEDGFFNDIGLYEIEVGGDTKYIIKIAF